MSQTTTSPASRDFVAYEYTTVKADRDLESLYRDSYQNFGWELEGYGSGVPSPNNVSIKLKRDRRIKNRSAVAELQRTCERALESIAGLERSKNTSAFTAALTVGILGCVFLAGSIFAIEASMWTLSIPLGGVGLILWLAGYLVHGKVKARRTRQVDPLIDRQYEIVYDTGEQAARLLR